MLSVLEIYLNISMGVIAIYVFPVGKIIKWLSPCNCYSYKVLNKAVVQLLFDICLVAKFQNCSFTASRI